MLSVWWRIAVISDWQQQVLNAFTGLPEIDYKSSFLKALIHPQI